MKLTISGSALFTGAVLALLYCCKLVAVGVAATIRLHLRQRKNTP